MAAYAPSPQSYQHHSVLTAPPEQLVVMLYDGALRFLRQTVAAMGIEDFDRAGRSLNRAEAIIDELLVTLDMEAGGEVAAGLRDLYLFCRRHLTEGRMQRDPQKVAQVAELLAELRESWATIATA